jgi:hypothetical protein
MWINPQPITAGSVGNRRLPFRMADRIVVMSSASSPLIQIKAAKARGAEARPADRFERTTQGETRPDPAAVAQSRHDVALECTGIFTERATAAKLIEAGANRVIVSAPAVGADMTVVMGVNIVRPNTGLSRTPRAPRTVLLLWPMCCNRASASSAAI